MAYDLLRLKYEVVREVSVAEAGRLGDFQIGVGNSQHPILNCGGKSVEGSKQGTLYRPTGGGC